MNVKGKLNLELEHPIQFNVSIDINSLPSAYNAIAILQHQVGLLKSIANAENSPPKQSDEPIQVEAEVVEN
jgi:hypothetical protein